MVFFLFHLHYLFFFYSKQTTMALFRTLVECAYRVSEQIRLAFAFLFLPIYTYIDTALPYRWSKHEKKLFLVLFSYFFFFFCQHHHIFPVQVSLFSFYAFPVVNASLGWVYLYFFFINVFFFFFTKFYYLTGPFGSKNLY